MTARLWGRGRCPSAPPPLPQLSAPQRAKKGQKGGWGGGWGCFWGEIRKKWALLALGWRRVCYMARVSGTDPMLAARVPSRCGQRGAGHCPSWGFFWVGNGYFRSWAGRVRRRAMNLRVVPPKKAPWLLRGMQGQRQEGEGLCRGSPNGQGSILGPPSDVPTGGHSPVGWGCDPTRVTAPSMGQGFGFRGGTVLTPSTPGGRGEPRWGHVAPAGCGAGPARGINAAFPPAGWSGALQTTPKPGGFAFGVRWLGEQEK